MKFADLQVTTGEHAEAYASYIGGHVAGIADEMTYAEMSGPERAANAAVVAFVGAAVMLTLVLAGTFHLRRMHA